jgi:DNA-binding LacI/PurR family transcriptional regulator
MSSPSITDQIKDYIIERRLKPGSRLPSERVFAATFGTSQASVNRALHFLIGNGQLRRVGYKLFVAGDVKHDQHLKLRAFIPEETPKQAARKTAQLLGCDLSTPVSVDENVVRKALLALKPSNMDGLLLWGSHHHDLLQPLADAGLPIIVCDATSSALSSVSADQSRIGGLAVEHLASLGHKQIGHLQLITRATHALDWAVVADGYSRACQRLRLSASATRIAPIYNDTQADAAAAWTQLAPRKSGITALVCPHPRIAQHVIALARKEGLSVPAELSILVLQETTSAAANHPPLTAVSSEIPTIARLGVFLLHEMATQPSSRKQIRAKQITVEPVLIARASTASPPGHGHRQEPPAATDSAAPGSWPMINIWSTDARRRIAQAATLNQTPFPTRPCPGSRYIPVDLTAQANRACSREHTWLGDEPLRHLPTGEIRLHGVPLQLIDENQNAGHAAVVLRSEHAHSSSGRPLPTRVTVPISKKVSALYILHGAGWTDHHRPFAEYVFRYQGGTVERVSVIPYATATSNHPTGEAWREESLVQDWHPMHPRFESHHTLPCVITEGGDPFNYERYLYVWQWINPHPERRLHSLSLRTLNPADRTTIGLLAITMQTHSSKI